MRIGAVFMGRRSRIVHFPVGILGFEGFADSGLSFSIEILVTFSIPILEMQCRNALLHDSYMGYAISLGNLICCHHISVKS